MSKILSPARLNYKNYYKMSKACRLCFAIGTVFLLTSLTMISGFERLCESFKEGDPKYHAVSVKCIDENGKTDHEAAYALSHAEYVSDASVRYEYFPEVSMPLKPCLVSVDGYRIPMLTAEGADRRYSLFDKATLSEKGLTSENCIVAGRAFGITDENCALIDENYAYLLGYDTPGDMVGKTVNISCNGVQINRITITGVYAWQLGYQDGCKKDCTPVEAEGYLSSSNLQMCFFAFSDDVIDELCEKEMGPASHNTALLLYVDSIENVSAVCSFAGDTLGLSTESDVYEIERKKQIAAGISLLLESIAVVVEIMALVYMINVVLIKCDKQEKFMHILRKIGYGKKEICAIYCAENAANCLRGMVPGIVFSLMLCFVFDMRTALSYRKISDMKYFVFLPDVFQIVSYSAMLILFVLIVTWIAVSKRIAGNE